jgi:hypothetical protein
MDEAHWQELLIRGGVAPRRARRALREFAQHRTDIILERLQLGETAAEGTIAADARLGSARLLVEAMLARPELKSWAQRRPWAVFAVAPLLAFCALFAFVLPPASEPPELSIGIGFSSASLVPPLTRAALTGALTLLPYIWARRIVGARPQPGTLT